MGERGQILTISRMSRKLRISGICNEKVVKYEPFSHRYSHIILRSTGCECSASLFTAKKDGENSPHTSLQILVKCTHRSAEQGPLWGCDRVGVRKPAYVPVRRHPATGSHPRARGPCSAVRGRTSLRFAPRGRRQRHFLFARTLFLIIQHMCREQ